jgi:hypothetical protein
LDRLRQGSEEDRIDVMRLLWLQISNETHKISAHQTDDLVLLLIQQVNESFGFEFSGKLMEKHQLLYMKQQQSQQLQLDGAAPTYTMLSFAEPVNSNNDNNKSAHQTSNADTGIPMILATELRHRLCKYALNTIMEVFKQTVLAEAVQASVDVY